MAKISAGLLLYQTKPELKVLLVHPGGPFFTKKDAGAWSIPKGEIDKDEDPLEVAIREFEEETGQKPFTDNYIALGQITQAGGKVVYAWAIEGKFDPNQFKSNSFKIEWPPKSGRIQSFPEIDKAQMFDIKTAKIKINPAQIKLLEKLISLIYES